ncbi:MAG: acyl-CoA dehydrogenase family protein, partial [Rhodospirillaceae bacterium]
MTISTPAHTLTGTVDEPWFREEHILFREQVKRFVDEEVKPKADAWEETGFVPRPILRQMGELGFLGVRYPEEFGGSAMDTIATAVLAEELGKSTFGGFAVTVLVHTDMASPHLVNAGSKEQIAKYLPDIIAGKK